MTAHMTQDQVFVPPTRSERGLPPFDPTREDRLGASVTEDVKKELWEALGDSPIGAALGSASYLVRDESSLFWPIAETSLVHGRSVEVRIKNANE